MQEITQFELMEILLSQRDLILGAGFNESDYLRSVDYVMKNNKIYTPKDQNRKQLLIFDATNLDENDVNDDAIRDIIDMMFINQNHYDIDFYVPEDDSFDYAEFCNSLSYDSEVDE